MFLNSVNLWNLAFYAFMVFMATLGLWDVFFGFEENKCSMSYMFEYPEYQVRVRSRRTWALQDLGPSVGSPALVPCALRPLRPIPPPSSPPGRLCRTPPHLPLCPFLAVECFLDGFRSILPAPLVVAPVPPPFSRPQVPSPSSSEWPRPTLFIPRDGSLPLSLSPKPTFPALLP